MSFWLCISVFQCYKGYSPYSQGHLQIKVSSSTTKKLLPVPFYSTETPYQNIALFLKIMLIYSGLNVNMHR
jgi:hypothetical protein